MDTHPVSHPPAAVYYGLYEEHHEVAAVSWTVLQSLQLRHLCTTPEEERAYKIVKMAYGMLRRFSDVHLSPLGTTEEAQYVDMIKTSLKELYQYACLAEKVGSRTHVWHSKVCISRDVWLVLCNLVYLQMYFMLSCHVLFLIIMVLPPCFDATHRTADVFWQCIWMWP